MKSGQFLKTAALIIMVMSFLQTSACFIRPCNSCLRTPDIVDTSDNFGSNSDNNDADSCGTTVCCAEYIIQDAGITLKYAPLESLLITPERYYELPTVVIPIFVPPQNLA
jgi:hypothetical protein